MEPGDPMEPDDPMETVQEASKAAPRKAVKEASSFSILASEVQGFRGISLAQVLASASSGTLVFTYIMISDLALLRWMDQQGRRAGRGRWCMAC